jgi:hypothetical protein
MATASSCRMRRGLDALPEAPRGHGGQEVDFRDAVRSRIPAGAARNLAAYSTICVPWADASRQSPATVCANTWV